MAEAINIKETTKEKISGQDYKNLIISAACELEKSKGEINDLNVFPVPDGDTGSNMSLTVGNAAKELLNDESRGVDEASEKTARAMLRAARGNSGVIISLMFRGIAKVLKNSFECDGIAWAEALTSGVEAAYSAVENPADGTILTVAKKCAEAASAAAEIKNDFEFVLSSAIGAAEEALEKTVSENPILARAGVVDAGGMGWLVVMKAMRMALNGKVYSDLPKINEVQKAADFSSAKSDEITFVYCTEFIIKKKNSANVSAFKSYLKGKGDSLVTVDDGEIIKVHIHTNNPHDVLGEALKYGEYENVKVENMRTQHTDKIASYELKKNKKYGFVAVASGQGFEELFTELGVDRIVSGGQTMNPSCEEICDAVEKISADTVFLLPNNKNVIMACEQVKKICKKNVMVIPTKTVPEGISAMLGFDEGSEMNENLISMTKMSRGVSTIQITCAAKSTDFEGASIRQGEYLAVQEKELLSNGKELWGVLDRVSERIKGLKKSTVSIYYGSEVNKGEAEKLLAYLQGRLIQSGAEINLYYGGQPIYYYVIAIE